MQITYTWLNAEDLRTERQQCIEEGRDISSVEPLFDELIGGDLTDPRQQERAMGLLDRTIELPIKAGYKFHEPSDLEGIRAARPPVGTLLAASLPRAASLP